jgi:hypothetical protein
MNRYTFVIQIHSDGVSTLENLSTHERVPVSDMSAVGPQIERWLSRDVRGEEFGADGGAGRTVPSRPPIPDGARRRT